ncbi:MAG: phosphatase PAP2 family protein [Phycisphaerales bacterium]
MPNTCIRQLFRVAVLLGASALCACQAPPVQLSSTVAMQASSRGRILSDSEAARLRDLLPGPYPQRPGASPAQTAELNRQLAEAEVQFIRAVQDDATAQALARANRVDASDPLWEFAVVLGPHFNATECPRLRDAVAAAESEANAITNAAKKKFPRPRPPGSGITTDDAYPSGHAVRAFFRARLLAEIAPAKKDELLRAARIMVLNRVIAGKHHPSDCVGSILLGSAIADAMLTAANDESTAFHAELEAAKKEWRVLITPTKDTK